MYFSFPIPHSPFPIPPFSNILIETFQLITLTVCCGYASNLIGRRTINIPEIILGVHGFMGFTVIRVLNGKENVTFKMTSQSLKLLGDYSDSFNVSNAVELSRS